MRTFVLVGLLACKGSASSTSTEVAPSAPAPTPVSTPTPPPTPTPAPDDPLALPPDLAAGLPVDPESGLPILLSGPGELPGGIAIQLEYDASQSDPITDYADCLGLVTDCFPGGDARDCVLALRCSARTGPCCPDTCIDAFEALQFDPNQAALQVFPNGTCFTEMAAYRDAFGTPEPQ